MTVNDAPTTSASSNPHPPANPIQAFLVFVFRLLLLGVGGGFAWLLGVVIAQFYPAQPQNPPLQEGIMRHTSAVIRDLRRLPRRWNQPEPTLNPSPIPAVIPSPTSEASPTPTPNPTATPASLTLEQRQQLQSELETLQTELQSLRDRTTELENQLGQTQASADVEARIQTLEQRLNGGNVTTPAAEPPEISSSPSPQTSSSEPDSGILSPPSGPVSDQRNDLMVTLPSDVLFVEGQNRLRPETQIILDSIIRDLQSYPGAAIRVAAHTDNSAPPPAVRNLSFQQAEAIQQYMEQALGDRNHWVVIGYGAIRPLVANDTDLNRQRNRRIEIMIEPQ